jgi:hypothetical protein
MNRVLLLLALSTTFLDSSHAQATTPPKGSTETNNVAIFAGFQDEKEPDWTKYGTLEKTELKCEYGQPIYALKDGNKLITYITTKEGKSLTNYIGAVISVYGPTMDLPKKELQYVLASHVAVGDPVIAARTRSFAVPLIVSEKQKEKAKSVRILVSEDRGKSWKLVKECKPSEKQIEFEAKRDDLYLFALQIVNNDGKTDPKTEPELVPVLRIYVNTTKRIREIENNDSELQKEVEIRRRMIERLEKRIKELESERESK